MQAPIFARAARGLQDTRMTAAPLPSQTTPWNPRSAIWIGLLCAVAAAMLTAVVFFATGLAGREDSLRNRPHVVQAVRDLSRLEGASMHLERVIDLTDRQSRFFGLVQTEDAILLVAAVDVTAGVDLGKLKAEDVTADWETRSVRIVLPRPEVFSERLDSKRTYVHARTTGLLAKRDESLEGRARQEAERQAAQAAIDAGLLDRAGANASRAVEALARSLGYEKVEVSTAKP